LWSELVCETAAEHWSIGLEAFGVRLDRAGDGLTGEIGERIALGFDFEWEMTGDPFSSEVAGAVYDEQPGVVRGEILLGRDRIPLDTVGRFEHSVGPVDATEVPMRFSVAWDDGSWWSLRGSGFGRSGARWEGGRAHPVDARSPETREGGVMMRSWALIPVGDEVLERALGAADSEGRLGTGWMESVPARRAKIT
jgi:hypothetical protein